MSTPYYPNGDDCGTDGPLPAYNCSPCPQYEYGRIRSIALVKTSFTFIDPSKSSEWAAGIANDNIRVIWETQGSYDGGSTSELAGFGDRETTNGGTKHTLIWKDPNYTENADFYNGLRYTSEWTLVYRTSNSIHTVGEPCTFTPKNPVQDDTKSNVVWDVQAVWSSPNSPVPYRTPAGIFDRCYIS